MCFRIAPRRRELKHKPDEVRMGRTSYKGYKSNARTRMETKNCELVDQA